jgi:uncharacterized membrane protein
MKRVADTEAGPWIVRFARGHIRLWLSTALGLAIFVLAPAPMELTTRLLVTWNIGIACYLIATAVMFARALPADIRFHADMQDEGAYTLLVLTATAAVASFGAIFAELAAIERGQPDYPVKVALTLITVALSWTFTHTIFALRYAHEFYGTGHRARGLEFPGDKPPDYWDFVYFAFVIGMTFQVSDVAVTNKWIRRTVVAHGVLSFLFTTAIVALAVNIAASLAGK